MIAVAIQVCVVSICLTAVVMDLKFRKIPNWLTLPAVGLGFLFGFITGGLVGLGLSAVGAGIGGLGLSAVGAGIGLLLLVPVLRGGVGGGDLKFQTAIGALMGPLFVAVAFVIGAALGAVMGLGYAAWLTAVRRKSLKDALTGKFAYAPALAGGAISALLLGFGQ